MHYSNGNGNGNVAVSEPCLATDELVYLLIDGENIDRTLGQILEGKPLSHQRPRWDRIKQYVEKQTGKTCRALFFINAWRGLHGPFIQALRAGGYIPIPLQGEPNMKVVDVGIINTLEALKAKTGDIWLASHDADFKEALMALHEANPTRKLNLIGFQEYFSGEYGSPFTFSDLEEDVQAFEGNLPRIRVMHVDDYNPHNFI